MPALSLNYTGPVKLFALFNIVVFFPETVVRNVVSLINRQIFTEHNGILKKSLKLSIGNLLSTRTRLYTWQLNSLRVTETLAKFIAFQLLQFQFPF